MQTDIVSHSASTPWSTSSYSATKTRPQAQLDVAPRSGGNCVPILSFPLRPDPDLPLNGCESPLTMLLLLFRPMICAECSYHVFFLFSTGTRTLSSPRSSPLALGPAARRTDVLVVWITASSLWRWTATTARAPTPASTGSESTGSHLLDTPGFEVVSINTLDSLPREERRCLCLPPRTPHLWLLLLLLLPLSTVC